MSLSSSTTFLPSITTAGTPLPITTLSLALTTIGNSSRTTNCSTNIFTFSNNNNNNNVIAVNNSNNNNSNNSRTDISVSHFCSAFKAFQQQQQQQNGNGNKKALFEFNMKGNWIFLHLRNSCSPQKRTKDPFFAKWHFSQKKELCNLTKASNTVKYYPREMTYIS